jgi:hypothetical protein
MAAFGRRRAQRADRHDDPQPGVGALDVAPPPHFVHHDLPGYRTATRRACGLVDRAPRLDAAGTPVHDKDGNPVIDETPIYTFHALRHAAASLFIEQGWSPKKLQAVNGEVGPAAPSARNTASNVHP